MKNRVDMVVGWREIVKPILLKDILELLLKEPKLKEINKKLNYFSN